jgi:hypothetical protein
MTITNIVVSRYNRNVDFAYNINNNVHINVLIYDKLNPNNPLNIPVNKGNEASVYLKYIVDYYDNLSDFTFFIHDEEYSWHHSGSIIDKYKEAVNSNKQYYNVNDRCSNAMIDILPVPNFIEWYNEYIGKYIPLNVLDLYEINKNAAQFLVHKDLILCLPKSFYEKLYNWIITTELSNYFSGRYLEWTWHIMFEVYPKLLKTNSIKKSILCVPNNYSLFIKLDKIKRVYKHLLN